MNLMEFNSLDHSEIFDTLIKCCSSSAWANELVRSRPFEKMEDLLIRSEKVWFSLNKKDWLEAFAGHPQIGDLKSLQDKYSNTKSWATGEQSGVASANNETLQELAQLNQQYVDDYGFIFIVCATGKSADEMLEILKSRLENNKEEELLIAGKEQLKITTIRLEKLL